MVSSQESKCCGSSQEHDSTQSVDQTDEFVTFHLHDVLDIYFDFKERFSYNPYFLEYMRSTHLTDYITHVLYGSPYPSVGVTNYTKPEYVYERFLIEYQTELAVSGQFIERFLRQFNHTSSAAIWNEFCFYLSYVEDL